MKPLYIFTMIFVMHLLLVSHTFSQVQTLVLRPGPADAKGAELTTYDPDGNYGWSQWFDGNAWTAQGTPLIIRSLIEFDLTSIPPSAEVVSATLSLFCNPNSTHYQLQAGDNQSYLLRITEPWDENAVTWNNQPEASMEDPVIIPTSTSNTQNYPDINVTSHVADMVANPAANYGWMIRLITEELYRSMQLSSGQDDEQYRPILTIQFIDCDMPIADWGYQLGYNDETVLFADSSISGTSILSWFWSFGDGYSATLQNPVHNYIEYGHYFVCLTVTDSCGTATSCDTVDFCPPMQAAYTYQSTNLSLQFTDQSAHGSSWFWSFGDGFFSDLQNPLHVFNDPGKYQVCLTVSDSCSTETVCDSINVSPSVLNDLTAKDVNIYPNPAADKLFIEFSDPSDDAIRLTVVDVRGKELLSRTLAGEQDELRSELDVTSLQQGLYFLKIGSDNKTVIKKFIIIR